MRAKYFRTFFIYLLVKKRFYSIYFCYESALVFLSFKNKNKNKEMDDIDDFFNRNKPVVRKKISGGTTNGRIKIDAAKKPNRSDEFASTSQYAEPHIAENQQQLMDVIVVFSL